MPGRTRRRRWSAWATGRPASPSAAGSVWVANSLDGTVTRIDPRTNTVTATDPRSARAPTLIAIERDAVWVSEEFSEEIARIDPAKDQVVERIPVANRPKGLALLENRVWFAVQASGSRPSRRAPSGRSPELIDGSIDPNFISWAGTGDSLSTAYDGLVAVARRGGSEGTQIVPNLAENLPVITNGETRYAFQLRRGVRYSNGTLVKAATSGARSSGRSGRRGCVGDVPLVGIEACTRRPHSCDLSQGVQTDDETGTIVFHLRRPVESASSSRTTELAGSDPGRHAEPGSGDASGPLDRAVHDRELRAGTGAHARPQSLLPRAVESRQPGRVPGRDRVQTSTVLAAA